jgi:hypothetical protein
MKRATRPSNSRVTSLIVDVREFNRASSKPYVQRYEFRFFRIANAPLDSHNQITLSSVRWNLIMCRACQVNREILATLSKTRKRDRDIARYPFERR